MHKRGFLAFHTEGQRKVADGLFQDEADARYMCPDATVIEVALQPMAGGHHSFIFSMLPGSDVTWPSTESRPLITYADVRLIRDLAHSDRLAGIVALAKSGVLDRHVRDHS